MSPAAAWRWCAVAGAVAFACSWGFGRIPGLVACGTTGGPLDQVGPIIAFELARTPAEVAALFGSDPCRSAFVNAQRSALLLDAMGFIPAYTAFLSLASHAAARRWRWPVIAGLIAAGLCDEVEGGLLAAILRDLPGSTAVFAALSVEVHLKFALLALGTMAIGAFLIARRRMVAGLFGLVVLAGGAVALYGVLGLPDPVMMQGFALGWFALLAAAFTASVAPSLFSPARAHPPRRRATPSA